MLEVLDPYVYKTVAEQRVERLERSMRAARRATSIRRRVAVAFMAAAQRLDRSAVRRSRPCPDALPSRS